jgi:hypothetical protein
VSIGLAGTRHDIAEASAVASVEIDVHGRWDALALSEMLIPFHSFLVQQSAERWVVHARSPGCRGGRLADALSAIEEWRTERGIEATVRVDGRPLVHHR